MFGANRADQIIGSNTLIPYQLPHVTAFSLSRTLILKIMYAVDFLLKEIACGDPNVYLAHSNANNA